MNKVAILARLEAKPGKEMDLESLLISALGLANAESETPVWYALKLSHSTYGIFDAFAAESGRQAHLHGHIAQALMAQAPHLLAEAPQLQMVDILAEKLAP
jgi:quinol monooxygenase YgiN